MGATTLFAVRWQMAKSVFAVSLFFAVCLCVADGKELLCRQLADGKELADGKLADSSSERSVRQRFRIGREGRRAVTGSKSKSIYPSIKKATPH